MQVLKDKHVIIRKQQMCFGCYRKFPIGTTMNYWVNIYEGDFCAGYTCKTCEKLMIEWHDEFMPDGFPEGFVREALNEGQTPEDLLIEISETQIVKPKK